MAINMELPEEITLRDDETIEATYDRSYISFLWTRVIPGAIGGLIFMFMIYGMVLLYANDIIGIVAPGQGINIIIFVTILFLAIIIPAIILAVVLGKPYC